MNIMRPLVVVALAYCFTASAVFAQDNFARVGPYVGGGFAYGIENFGLGNIRDAAGLSADNAPGLDARGGYRVHPNFAVEGDLQFFAFDLNADQLGNIRTNTQLATLYTLSFMANAKGYALTGRIQPYGLFGLGVLSASLDPQNGSFQSHYDAVFAVHFGGGVDVYVTPKIVINVECAYVLPTSDVHFGDTGQEPGVDLSFIPIVVGMQYRF